MTGAPLGRLIIEMGLDDTNFAKGVTGARKQLIALKNDLRTSREVVANFGHGIDGVAKPTEVLTKMIQTQERELRKLNTLYDKSFNNGKASQNTQKYAAQISKANAQLVNYQGQLKQAVTEQYKQSSVLPKLSEGFEKVSSGMDALANKTAPMTIGITAAFAKGVQAATNFNDQMTEIRALLSDGTPAAALSKQMDTLASKSKGWAKQYGIDTSSINEGMEEMIKRGYDFNQTVGAMPSVLDAARASGDDFGTVMSSSTAILEQFGLKTNDTASMMKNTQRVTDSLTFVANKTSAGFSDMGTAMEYVGLVAHSLNMSLEETSAAIGLLSNNGIEGDKAGTSLRGALTRLLKPTKESALAFEQLGINLDEWKKGNIGLPDMLDKIKHSTEGMTDAEKSSLIAKAFGTQAQTGMNILIEQGGDALRNLTKETQNATGYTKKLADQMNNSDKNAFNKAKASLEVLSIDLGQKLLPSIVPIVKEVDNLAGAFAKLDPKTQQFIIKMALGAAAIAPTSKALSGFTKIISGVSKGLGALGEKGAAKFALRGITTEATGATAAIGGAGGLSSSLTGISPILAGIGPAAVGALGVAGLAGAIVIAQKATEKARGELQQIHDWGTVVGTSNNEQLTNFQEKLENFNAAFSTFESSGTNAAKNVTQAFKDLAGVTTTDIENATDTLIKKAKAFGISDKEINDWKAKMDQQKANVQTMSDQVIQIYTNAANQYRELSAEEREIVKNNEQEMISAEINALSVSGEKKKAIQIALNENLNTVSKAQLKKYQSDLEEAVRSENESYRKTKEDLKQLFNQGMIEEAEYNAKLALLNDQHRGVLETLGNGLAKVMQQSLNFYQTDGAAAEAWHEKTAQYFKENGMNYDEITQKMQEQVKASKDSSGLISEYTANMTADGKKAADEWNAIIYDPKKGEVSTNATEVVAKALSAEGGWQNIQWIEKHANLSTNAMITIAEAAQANGMWNALTPEQKNLIVNNKEGLAVIVNSKENLAIWNSLPVNIKNMLGNNSDFVTKKEAAAKILEAWNQLTPKEKELKAKNLTVQPKEEAQRVIDSLHDKRVTLGALNGTIVPTFQAQKTVDSLKGKDVPLTATDNTGTGKNSAQRTMNGLQDVYRGLFANNNVGPTVSAANNAIQKGFNGKTAELDADDSSARTTLNGFLNLPAIKTINIQPHILGPVQNAQGTPYHPGGLAMVNDQKGPTYKELITLPNGNSFIPEGRNVTLPLPRGTKILKASKTAQLIPKYAQGIGGIPENSRFFQQIKATQQGLEISVSNEQNQGILKEILKVLSAMNDNNDLLYALKNLAKRPAVSVFDTEAAAKALESKITAQQTQRNLLESMLGGKRP
ncbi:phage tail tape measure protein [Lactococcus lactis]